MGTRLLSFLAVAALASSSLAFPVKGDILVNYQFNAADLSPANMLNAGNTTGAGTISPSSASADLTSSGLTIAAANGQGGNGSGDSYSLGVYNSGVIDHIPSNILYMRDTLAHSTSAAAITNGDYFDLVLTPVAGKTLSLTSLTADGRDNNGVRGMGVWASTDGVNFSHMGSDTAGWLGYDGAAWVPTAVSIDLSSLSGLSGPVTLRFGIISDANGGAFLDNLTINGTTASGVPEPASLSVLGLGVMGLLIRRKNAK